MRLHRIRGRFTNRPYGIRSGQLAVTTRPTWVPCCRPPCVVSVHTVGRCLLFYYLHWC